jgi:hypothetical protein
MSSESKWTIAMESKIDESKYTIENEGIEITHPSTLSSFALDQRFLTDSLEAPIAPYVAWQKLHADLTDAGEGFALRVEAVARMLDIVRYPIPEEVMKPFAANVDGLGTLVVRFMDGVTTALQTGNHELANELASFMEQSLNLQLHSSDFELRQQPLESPALFVHLSPDGDDNFVQIPIKYSF